MFRITAIKLIPFSTLDTLGCYVHLFFHTFPWHALLRLGPPCEGGLCGGLLKGPPKPAEGSAGSLKHSNGASENLSKSWQPTVAGFNGSDIIRH